MNTPLSLEAKQAARDQLNAMLDKFLAGVRETAHRQLEYAMDHNIPQFSTEETVAEASLVQGIASGVTRHWSADCIEAMRIAGAILEDSNCHREAAPLLEVVKKADNPDE